VKTPDWPEIILKGLEEVLWLFRAIQIPSEVVPTIMYEIRTDRPHTLFHKDSSLETLVQVIQ
jgi:hypothetical protein